MSDYIFLGKATLIMLIIFLVLALLGIPFVEVTDEPTPRTFNQCVIDNMKHQAEGLIFYAIEVCKEEG